MLDTEGGLDNFDMDEDIVLIDDEEDWQLFIAFIFLFLIYYTFRHVVTSLSYLNYLKIIVHLYTLMMA